jgi:hypothetical protein
LVPGVVVLGVVALLGAFVPGEAVLGAMLLAPLGELGVLELLELGFGDVEALGVELVLVSFAGDDEVEVEVETDVAPELEMFRAASVWESAWPEALIPLDCWNFSSAACVFGPILPSTEPTL